jgi:hypothetical protein
MWFVIGVSAIWAAVRHGAAGARGAVFTAIELCLPPAYSVPPLRVKQRAWFGVAADALAAHVYPALLALVAVAQWSLRPVTPALAVVVVVWAAAAGLRGILSHQLSTAEEDRRAGLRTVVHHLGNQRLERFVVAVLLPIEVGTFGAALLLCNGGPVLWTFVGLYLIYEAFKTRSGRFSVRAFRPGGQTYVPFVEELLQSLGADRPRLGRRRIDPLYLVLIPAYAVLFRPHVEDEVQRLRSSSRRVASAEPRRLSAVPMKDLDVG